jgi:hypothetical protein
MSHPAPDDEAERHRQAAAATEHHATSGHHHPEHKSSGGGAYDKPTGGHGQEQNESTFFVRHRGKVAAGLMVVLAIIFFTFVFGFIRF